MKILVIGSTGPTGRLIVAQALELGHEVTAGARRPEEAGFPAAVRTVKLDASSYDSLAAAVAGHDAVISSLGSKPTRKPQTLLSSGTANLVKAMKACSVARLVCITGVGAGDSRGHGGFLYDRIIQPLILSEVYKDKDRQEAVVRSSGLDWTLVRPGALTNGPKVGKIQCHTDLTGVTMGKISRADAAAFAVTCVADKAAREKTFNIFY